MRQVSWIHLRRDVVINKNFHEALQDCEVVLDALVHPPGILVFCPGTVVDLKLQEADYGEDLLQSMDF
jgi:hypothetical protein